MPKSMQQIYSGTALLLLGLLGGGQHTDPLECELQKERLSHVPTQFVDSSLLCF